IQFNKKMALSLLPLPHQLESLFSFQLVFTLLKSKLDMTLYVLSLLNSFYFLFTLFPKLALDI
ncbi:hypothetical protein, partial [Avibacterium avium]|uniref:hypothetical protein n=1 Tax=Avibacterium avium TaxID=751 RepID=UPI003BF88742